LGGSARVSRFRDIGNDIKTFVVDLEPRIGFFFASHWLVNASATLTYTTSKTSRTTQFGAGPGVAYYMGGNRTRVHPYAQARLLLLRTVSEVKTVNIPRLVERSVGWSAAAGAVLMIARNAGVTGELFYMRTGIARDFSGGVTSNSAEEYGVRFGVSVFVF
jgi:hypothetical protein